MDDATLNALSKRLERVERENQWLRRMGALGLVVVGAVFLMGQAFPGARSVETDRVVVKDRSGKVRVVLGEITAADETRPAGFGLTLYDADGDASALLYDQTAPKGARLFVLGPGSSASVAAEQESSVTLQAYKTPRKEWDRFVARVSKDFLDHRITAEEHARLTGRGVTALVLNVKESEPSLMLSDDNRIPRAVLGPWRLVAPGVAADKPDVEQRGPASLVLFDNERRVIWKAP